ncbi:MAG: hypothetical protein IPL23_16970 [Saprospiraceae bacterium]|nr:hypothetical protein [Saprospiraceae bacterium]
MKITTVLATLMLLWYCQSLVGQNNLGAAKVQNKGRFPAAGVITQSSGLALDPDGIHFWTHNDQGNATTKVYKFLPANGNTAVAIVDSVQVVGHENLDWEDMAKDQNGNLYLCQTGKNCNALSPSECPGRYLYKILKMPFASLNAQASIVPDSFIFKYPLPPACNQNGSDTTFVNAEAAIFFNNSIYIFTKNIWSKVTNNCGNWVETSTYLFKIPLTAGSSAANPIVGEYLGSYNLKLSEADSTVNYYKVIAGAINPSQQVVSLVTPARVWQFRNFTGDNFFNGDVSYHSFLDDGGNAVIRGYEGADFYNNDLLYLSVDGTNGRLSTVNIDSLCTNIRSLDDHLPGSLRTALSCASQSDTLSFNSAIANQNLIIDAQINITKNISIVNTQSNVTIQSLTNLPAMFAINPMKQVYLEGFNMEAANYPDNFSIQNNGNLTLKNITVKNFPGQTKNVINKTGATLTIIGDVDIKTN